MIRWRYLLTRLLVVAVILMLLRFGMAPVASYVTVAGLQTATGAKVDIGKTDVGLFPPRVRYEQVRVADPRNGKAFRDAFRADEIELSIDGEALLRRRWVAREGRITGLQIGTRREQTGQFEDEDEPIYTPSSKSSGALGKLLGGMTGQLQRQAEQAVADLETVRRSEEIKTRWESDYRQLVSRAKVLENQVREIRDSAREIDNPLRDWQTLDRTLATANEARAELKSVRNAIDAMPQRFRSDLASLEQAKQRDLERIDQYVPGDLGDSKNFGVDLISEAVREKIAGIRSYWEGGRALAGYTVVAPESQRSRGIDVDLLAGKRQPDILIRRCEVSGMMRADGNAYALSGVVENMTPQPEYLAEPLHARLELDGPQLVRVDYVRDRRSGNDVDLLTLHWPQSDAPAMSLGRDSDASLAVRGGKREVWVQLRSEGQQIQGRFVSKLTGVRMAMQVDSKYASLPALQSIEQSLAAVDTIEIDAGFNGTWELMKMDMNTNLGQVFQGATEQAVASQLAASKQALSEKVDRICQNQQLQLREWFNQQEGQARQLVAKADQLVEQLGEKMLGQVDPAEVTLGRMQQIFKGKLR
ncbi:TIGR03545 family protein [Roseiconus nitratireducens]|uniref:TIGR03545 family protein n=1 Tax=Roseiconus nitratireducens TaxID=2605748 RepID=A0A5M6DG53_9BACT|nr:TIGR03545 family protein [Roseiconus nitratireducens]KAA5545272.1 TIGR03545 family protein [Roseiconus nitratireducens]